MMLIKLSHQSLLVILIILRLINLIKSSEESSLSQSDVHKISKRASDQFWSYSDQKEWLNINGSHCGGDRQSPIDLDSSKAKVDKTLTLKMNSYDKLVEPGAGKVLQNGHSLRMTLVDPGIYTLTGSAVENSVFELQQVHIHWGTNSMSGSEHAIDGERFSAEIHFVHRNVKYSNDTSAAMKNPDGLTVLGVIAKNGDPNPGLDILIEALKTNKSNEWYLSHKHFDLNHFLPKNLKSFFKYSGSLTTPTCEEVVNWLVMKDTITVSNDQIDKLRNYMDSNGSLLETVVRDLQPRQGRTIFYSDSGSAIAPTLTSLCYIILYLTVHITIIQKSRLD